MPAGSTRHRWPSVVALVMVVIAGASLGRLALARWSDEFVPYVPVAWQRHGGMQSRPELLNDREHFERIPVHLRESDDVRVEKGTILMRRSLARDAEVLANHHTKMMEIPAHEIEKAWPDVAREFGVSP